MDVEWKEPPASVRGTWGKTLRFVEALKSRPGCWAVYPTPLSSAAGSSKYRKSYPGTEWTTRRSEDVPGKWNLYGRWVGES